MKVFQADTTGRTFIIRMEKGDLLKEAIADFVKKEGIENAVILSGIATFDEAHLQMTTTFDYPIRYCVNHLREPMELAGLDGTIIHFEPHLHGVISNARQTWAGHLLDGCRILYLAEIVIQELLCHRLVRRADQNGVNLITESEE